MNGLENTFSRSVGFIAGPKSSEAATNMFARHISPMILTDSGMEGQLEAGPEGNQLPASDVHLPTVEEDDPSRLIGDIDLRVQQVLNDSHAEIPASAVLSPTSSNLGACNCLPHRYCHINQTDCHTL